MSETIKDEAPWVRPEVNIPAVAARSIEGKLTYLDVPELLAEVVALRGERDEALAALQRIKDEVGTSTLAWKTASEALASHGKDATDVP
jgi:hypothetical protein